MDKEKVVKHLVRVQVLCMRYVERHSDLRYRTFKDFNRVITENKLTYSYEEVVSYLRCYINEYCSDSQYLKDEIEKVQVEIANSNIGNLRFGCEPQRKFTKEESELLITRIRYRLRMLNNMVPICDMATLLNYRVIEDELKLMCEREILMNTRIEEDVWYVHVPECREYFGIEKDSESLYFDL